MLSRLRDFVGRHRRKFIVTGVVVGGTYFALRYAQRKIIEMQEKQAREFLDKTRRIQHFESTEKTCNQVIIGMGAELMQAILKECSTEDLLRQLCENPPNKLELWEEMKIIAFTRLTTYIYASSMLVVALRVQLNVLGGYLYRDTTTAGSNTKATAAISDELKQQYLNFIRYFMHDGGLSALVRLTRLKIISVMRQLPLNKKLSLADLEQLFWSIQMSINSDPNIDPCSRMCKYLLPPSLPEYYGGNPQLLEKMFNETLDILESDDASSVCSNNICRGFSLAVDAIAESMNDTILAAAAKQKADEQETNKKLDASVAETSNNNYDDSAAAAAADNSLININSVQIALAKIIPIVSGLTAKGFDTHTRPHNLATSLVTFYVVSEKCKVLGSNIYETFSST